MPETIVFEDMPKVLIDNHVEPFREQYIPGSRVLCREWSSDGYDIYFQILTPVAQSLDDHELRELKNQVRGWWRTKTNKEEKNHLPKISILRS